MAKENDAEKEQLILAIDEAIQNAPKDKKSEYETFKKDYETRLADATRRYEKKVAAVTKETRENIAVVDMSAQEKAFVEMIGKGISAGERALYVATTPQMLDTSRGPEAKKEIDFSQMNIPSVLMTLMALKGETTSITESKFTETYRSNGAYWLGDKQQVPKLLDIWNAHKGDLIPVFTRAISFYEAKMTPVEAIQREKSELKDRAAINTALAQVPMLDVNARALFQADLAKLSDEDLIARWNGLSALNPEK